MTKTLQHEIILGLNGQEMDPRKGFRNHAEFFNAVRIVGLGGDVDPRLKPLATVGSDEQGGYSDPAGGFLIPEAWSPQTQGVQGEDPISGRTQPITMDCPVVHIGARVDKNHATSVSGGLTMQRRPETTEPSPTRIKMESLTLNSYELFGLTFIDDRLLTDSPQTFMALLERSYRDEKGRVKNEEIVRGSGAGEYLGVLNSGCLITVSKETGQAAASVLGDNFTNIRKRMWNYPSAIWLVNPDLYTQTVKATVTVGTGGSALPVWTPGNPESGSPDSILGRPAYFCDLATAAGSVGDVICAAFGEYLDGTYVPLRYDVSMHVRFVARESAFRFYERGDGMPWWRTPVTPRRSTVTRSPFCTLEART